MISLRKHYFLDEWVVVSEKRGQRPHEFISDAKAKPGIDFFAPKNEHLTPPEIGRHPNAKKWQMRWFANKFAAVESETFRTASKKDIHEEMPAFGYHEIIVETPDRKKQLWDLTKKQITQLLLIYKNRIKELSLKKHIKYVQVFKNHGKEGGTSLLHSHSQVVALPIVPKSILKKIKGIKKTKINYEKILAAELKTERKVFQTNYFTALCPYASRFNYEVWIIPKKKWHSMQVISSAGIEDLAKMLSKILKKIRKQQWPYNLYLQYDPKGDDMLFHVEITPRLGAWAGFELATGLIINSVSPEDAAAFYRS